MAVEWEEWTLTHNHADTRSVASLYHALELGLIAPLGSEDVGHRLVVGPPLSACDALLRRADWKADSSAREIWI